ncbi:transposase [Virgibacillus pantothenticus]|uniref:transposase n=1 Tax=Virgibacillus pantothenticus TaxID=1473 RepID=UPI000987384C|nr:transposase [Virgibacillus pantothenticus]
MILYCVLSTKHLCQKRRVPFVGIDDFAFKRRHKYGVIICDAQTSHPIDLLPDRTAETLKTWLAQYNTVIQRISRDRFARFREAINEVFPQTIQIHDRFHLIQNLWTLHNQIIKKVLPTRILKENKPSPSSSPLPLTKQEKRREQNAKQKWERAIQVKKLKEEGHSIRHIATMMNMDWRTVKADLLKEKPDTGERKKRSKPINDWTETVFTLEKNGRTVQEIYNAITEQGYKGPYSSVRVLVTEIRRKRKQGQTLQPSSYYTRNEIRRALWQWRYSTKEKDKAFVDIILKRYPELRPYFAFIQGFREAVSNRDKEQLREIVLFEKSRGDPLTKAFIDRLLIDFPSTLHACSFEESNGFVEGHVNRLWFLATPFFP